ILHAAVADTARVEARDDLVERRLREGERQVVHAARHLVVLGRPDRLPSLVREDRDEAAVAGVEIEVALGGVVEVRLLEDERHPEHALPEVDRRLALRSDDRDVVDALRLDLLHHRETSLDLYSLRCKLPKGTSS